MKSIQPSTAMYINLGLAVGGAALAYVAANGLPAPVPADVSHVAQAWAVWIGGFAGAVLATGNAYLHGVSADAAGPLAAPGK